MSGNFKTIKDSQFKYTIDENRKQLCKYIFPAAADLIEIIKSIPWSSFKYHATILWAYPIDVSRSGSEAIAAVHSADTEPLFTYKPAFVTSAPLDFLPYFFFGGCVYELMNTVYPTVNLRNYVDPTGDIDIRITLPFDIQYVHEQSDDPPYYLLNQKKGILRLNELLDAYTTWLFNEVYTRLKAYSMSRSFDNVFDESEPFDYTTNLEAVHPDNKAQLIKNLWLVRVVDIERKMIKIQLIAKFKDINENHILEFVLPIQTTPNFNTSFNYYVNLFKQNICMLTPSVPVQKPDQLIFENFRALRERTQLWNTPIKHKFYNHIGRFQYFNKLLPLYLKTLIKHTYETTTWITLAKLFKFIVYILDAKEKNELCLYDYDFREGNPCTPEHMHKILLSLVGNLKFMYKNPAGKAGAYNEYNSIGESGGVINNSFVTYKSILQMLPDDPMGDDPMSDGSMGGGRHTMRHKNKNNGKKTRKARIISIQ